MKSLTNEQLDALREDLAEHISLAAVEWAKEKRLMGTPAEAVRGVLCVGMLVVAHSVIAETLKGAPERRTAGPSLAKVSTELTARLAQWVQR